MPRENFISVPDHAPNGISEDFEPETIMDLFLGGIDYFPAFSVKEEIAHFTKLDQLREQYNRLLTVRENPDQQTQLENLRDQITQEKIIIANHNIAWVITVAKRYFGSSSQKPEELVQEGYFGMEHAIDKFEVKRGKKFSTYSEYWIRQSIRKFLKTTFRTIHTSLYAIETQLMIENIIDDHLKKTGENPTYDHIHTELKRRYKCNIEVENINDFLHLPGKLESLNDPVKSASGEELEEIIELLPNSEEPIEAQLIAKELNAVLLEMVKLLPERENIVLTHLYGLKGAQLQSRKQVAQALQISDTRVGQLEARALEHLRDYLLNQHFFS